MKTIHEYAQYSFDDCKWLREISDEQSHCYNIGGRSTDIEQIAYSIRHYVKCAYCSVEDIPEIVEKKIARLVAILELGSAEIQDFLEFMENELKKE